MSKSPAFQFYPDKFLAGTAHLTDRAFRAYVTTMCNMWLHSDDQCSISARAQAVCDASGLSSRQCNNVWAKKVMPAHRPMFTVEGNRIVCKGLQREAEKQEARRKAGRAGGLARQSLGNRCQIVADPLCLPSPTPSPIPVTNLSTTGGVVDDQLILRAKVRPDSVRQWIDDGHPAWAIEEALRRAIDKGARNGASYARAILQNTAAESPPYASLQPEAPAVGKATGPDPEALEAYNAAVASITDGKVRRMQTNNGRVIDVLPGPGHGFYWKSGGEKMYVDLNAFVDGGLKPYHGAPPARETPKADAKAACARRDEIQSQKVALLKDGGKR